MFRQYNAKPVHWISGSATKLSLSEKCIFFLDFFTGEFISVQTLHGKIISVRPQKANKCFLAVVETANRVGIKSATVNPHPTI